MNFLSIIFIGIGLAMDAFVVCIAKGMGLKKINLKDTINMALVFGIFQGVMTLIGYFVGGAFSKIVSKYSPIIVFIIFFVLGTKVLYEAFKGDGDEDEIEKSINFKDLMGLGFATSIDALAVGVSFGMMNGVSIYSSSLIIAIVTFLISLSGGILGTIMGSKINNKYAEIFGAIILIVMAFVFLFR
ncbi:manganese efflux pump MntP family protein [Clostridium sp.]|uniref:manganese efflux pump MntP n=1 Tax=Clostridium sp. TaxID=1506 RepID=UPI003992DA4D